MEPAPPDQVTYKWRTVEYIFGGNTYTQQNFSHTHYYNNLHYCWYFCDVLLNGTVISSTSNVVEIQGEPSRECGCVSTFILACIICYRLCVPIGSVVRSFNYGEQLQLIVNVSSEHSARYISSLAWYHNNTPIPADSMCNIINNYQRQGTIWCWSLWG